MNVAIIGVGKIGIYHIREFIKNNLLVKAILSSSKINGENNKRKIKEIYNIDVNFYTDINKLLTSENIDLVSICSPTNTHYDYIKICMQHNKNIFCEKPFVYNKKTNNIKRCIDILKETQLNNITINVNTQWVYGINQIMSLVAQLMKHSILSMVVEIIAVNKIFIIYR